MKIAISMVAMGFMTGTSAFAGGLTYISGHQILSGSFWMEDSVSGSESYSDSFEFVENSATPMNEAASIVATDGDTDYILMDGAVTSQFSENGFSFSAQVNVEVPNPNYFESSYDGNVAGEAYAFITFSVSEPTMVMYSLAAMTGAAFENVTGGSYIASVNTGASVSGVALLQPGVYAIDTWAIFGDEGFVWEPDAHASIMLEVIPAPGGVALFSVACLFGSRRRRA